MVLRFLLLFSLNELTSASEETCLLQLESQKIVKRSGKPAAISPTTDVSSLSRIVNQHALPISGSSCASYPNVLRVRGGFISGLSDRLTQLSSFSQIAQTLCARFVPEFRPCENLLKTLTGNKELPRDITWEHYVNFTTADGTKLLVLPPYRDSVTRESIEPRWLSSRTTPHFEEGFAKQFYAAKALGSSGTPFEWTLEMDWHEIPSPFSAMLFSPSGALFANKRLQPSGDVLDAARRLQSKAGLQKGKYVALHVRRGDAKGACDTSPEKVASFVVCSVKQDPKQFLQRDDVPILLFTDETDKAYLADLQANLKQAFGGRRSVIHGDQALSESSPDIDAPLIYATSLLLRVDAAAQMRMDRQHCNACDAEENTLGMIANAVKTQLKITDAAESVTNRYFTGSMIFQPQLLEPSCSGGRGWVR
jgi:hypothetical protein